MPKKAKALCALEVSRLSKPGMHFVGSVAGLILQVKGENSRSWVLRLVIGDKRRDVGLGSYPEITLAMARSAASAARLKVREGIDPIAERHAARAALIAQRGALLSFREASVRYIDAHESGWKSAKHAAQWLSTLESYAWPALGELEVSAIETPHVLAALEAIWLTRTETASRVRGRIESVLDWCAARGYRKGENPARWKGHLDHLLAAPGKVARVAHHAALDYRAVGGAMASLRSVAGIPARALEFCILTACRSGEGRGATWAEIDLGAGVWTIPATRMKAEREHRIPLSPAALALLEGMAAQYRLIGTGITASGIIFPNTKGGILSDVALSACLKRIAPDVTVHGFRSTFRDWAGETSNYPREVIEHALAHHLKDKAEASYARGTLFDKRAGLMAEWASHCAKESA